MSNQNAAYNTAKQSVEAMNQDDRLWTMFDIIAKFEAKFVAAGATEILNLAKDQTLQNAMLLTLQAEAIISIVKA